MSYFFPGVIVLFLLCVLWAPTAIALLRVNRADKRALARQIATLFPLELGIAVALILIADRIGLLNPAGYILGITVLVSGAGVAAVLFWPRTRRAQ